MKYSIDVLWRIAWLEKDQKSYMIHVDLISIQTNWEGSRDLVFSKKAPLFQQFNSISGW